MIRLVKGAYWDSEIKWAQVDGMDGYPVFTRKVHTDVSYLACAKKLFLAQDIIFPQFATHNAQTLATIYEMGKELDFEFRSPCTHLSPSGYAQNFACLFGASLVRKWRKFILCQSYRR